MKQRFNFFLSHFRASQFFAPLRGKRDTILLLLRTIKFMGVYESANGNMNCGELVLNVEKMSRLFFCDENKLFSIQFPFATKPKFNVDGETIEKYEFYSKNNFLLDEKITSELISLFSGEYGLINEEEYLEILTTDGTDKDKLISVVRELMCYESGYIRFDIDTKNENKKLHPLNHLDVFYTQSNTFKIGLYSGIDANKFIDILDVKTDCHFIEK